MYNEFEDLETELLFEQLINESNEEIIEEANINTKDIGAPKPPKGKGKYRNIMITGVGKHNGRMKISKPGTKINYSTSHDDYISIFIDKNEIECVGNLSNIKMDETEYQYYKDLFNRNYALMHLVKYGNGKYDNYVDNALISDENDRLSGLVINRSKENGDAEVYDSNGNLLYRKNIRGERI